MQSKEKDLIETRTFVQLFEDLKKDPQTRIKLQRELMYHLCISQQAIWKWAAGKTTPRLAPVRKDAARIVSRVLKCTCTADSLFPIK